MTDFDYDDTFGHKSLAGAWKYMQHIPTGRTHVWPLEGMSGITRRPNMSYASPHHFDMARELGWPEPRNNVQDDGSGRNEYGDFIVGDAWADRDGILKHRAYKFVDSDKDVDKQRALRDQMTNHFRAQGYTVLPPDAYYGKVAGKTRAWYLQRAAELPEDTSHLVHQFPDGWSIRKPKTMRDVGREGVLMNNCWKDICPTVNDAGEELDWNHQDMALPMTEGGYVNYSLRDPDNLPHTSFYLNPDGMVDEALGRHNSIARPEHLQRIGEAMNQEVAPYDSWGDGVVADQDWAAEDAAEGQQRAAAYQDDQGNWQFDDEIEPPPTGEWTPARERYPQWTQKKVPPTRSTPPGPPPGTFNWLDREKPGEIHGLGGDCVNPKCDHSYTAQEQHQLAQYGEMTCPSCGKLQNNIGQLGGAPSDEEYQKAQLHRNPVRAGISLTKMGQIGEAVVKRMGQLPCGPVERDLNAEMGYNAPVDFICGYPGKEYGVEVKANHSEAQPRFKLSGSTAKRQRMIEFCHKQGLRQGFCGVRLNFYNDKADVFWREGFTDTWYGDTQMQHIGTYDFSDLNPFRQSDGSHHVPANESMPDQSAEGEDDMRRVAMGLNGDLPEGLRFSLRATGIGSTMLEAFVGDQRVGYLTADKQGTISDVEVAWPRRGIATAMMQYLDQHNIPVRHDWGNLSGDAEAWIEKTYPHTMQDARDEGWYSTRGHLAKSGADHAGAMVALYLPGDTAKELHVEGGEPAKDMHITLAFFEAKAADEPEEYWAGVKDVVEAVAREFAPLHVTVSGLGRFNGDDDDDFQPLIGSIDCMGLAELHLALKEKLGDEYPLNTEHGWNPHVTIKYIDRDADDPNLQLPVEFDCDTLSLMIGGDRTDFEMTGEDHTSATVTDPAFYESSAARTARLARSQPVRVLSPGEYRTAGRTALSDWKDKNDYHRVAVPQAGHHCGDCGAFNKGHCSMFDAKVGNDFTCNEWVSEDEWRREQDDKAADKAISHEAAVRDMSERHTVYRVVDADETPEIERTGKFPIHHSLGNGTYHVKTLPEAEAYKKMMEGSWGTGMPHHIWEADMPSDPDYSDPDPDWEGGHVGWDVQPRRRISKVASDFNFEDTYGEATKPNLYKWMVDADGKLTHWPTIREERGDEGRSPNDRWYGIWSGPHHGEILRRDYPELMDGLDSGPRFSDPSWSFGQVVHMPDDNTYRIDSAAGADIAPEHRKLVAQAVEQMHPGAMDVGGHYEPTTGREPPKPRFASNDDVWTWATGTKRNRHPVMHIEPGLPKDVMDTVRTRVPFVNHFGIIRNGVVEPSYNLRPNVDPGEATQAHMAVEQEAVNRGILSPEQLDYSQRFRALVRQHARHLEHSYQTVHDWKQAGGGPDHLAVPLLNTQENYLTALHELGHVALGHDVTPKRQGRDWITGSPEDEQQAWQWAQDQMHEPLRPESHARMQEGLGSYTASKVAMPVGPLPDNITYKLLGSPKTKQCLYADTPEFDKSRQHAAYICWYEDGEIANVYVQPALRRMGVASELLRRAREINPNVHHSDQLSEDAQGWSQAVAKTAGGEWDWDGTLNTMYHVVPSDDAHKVPSQGIDYRKRDRSRDWRDDGDHEFYPEANYLSTDLNKAADYARQAGGTVYKVDASGLPLEPDVDDDWEGTSFFTREPIHPSRVLGPVELDHEWRPKTAAAMYHVAPAAARSSIQQNGLNMDLQDLDDNEPGVYAWDNPDAARRHVKELERIREMPHDVYEVHHDQWEPDPQAWGSVRSPVPIPPDRIRKTAMAQRTGDPAIDAAIQGYVDEFWNGTTTAPHAAETQGMCTDISNEFAEYAQESGIPAKVRYLDSPDEVGYQDRTLPGAPGEGHAVVDIGPYMVDFASSQFGYSEWPMVTHKGQRDWTAKTADWHEDEHPRNPKGEFTVKEGQHKIAVYDKKGKLHGWWKRCRHCGVVYAHPAHHEGRLACPTCGEDVDRRLRRVQHVAAPNQYDNLALSMGWQKGRIAKGSSHQLYEWQDTNGVPHTVAGYGNHNQERPDNVRNLRKNMNACMNGQCQHLFSGMPTAQPSPEVNRVDEPGAFLLKPGTKVQYGGKHWWVMDVDGGLAHIYDETGQEDIVPQAELRAARLRHGMAQQSGDPQLDALIDAFKQEQYGNGWEPIEDVEDWTPDERATDGVLPGTIEQNLKGVAQGQCHVFAYRFAEYCHEHGVEASSSEDETDENDTMGGVFRPEQFGYSDRSIKGAPNHCVTKVYLPSGTYMVDWTASQYGYKEFPMVQRLDQGGGWQREWTAKTAKALIPQQHPWLQQRTAAAPNLTFKWEEGENRTEVLVASVEGQEVGHIQIDKGRIYDVDVRPEWRRQGIATALYQEAQKEWGQLEHGLLTDDGKAWAEAVEPGGTYAPNDQEPGYWERSGGWKLAADFNFDDAYGDRSAGTSSYKWLHHKPSDQLEMWGPEETDEYGNFKHHSDVMNHHGWWAPGTVSDPSRRNEEGDHNEWRDVEAGYADYMPGMGMRFPAQHPYDPKAPPTFSISSGQGPEEEHPLYRRLYEMWKQRQPEQAAEWEARNLALWKAKARGQRTAMGMNGDLPEGLTFRISDGTTGKVMDAMLGGQRVGRMELDQSGRVEMVRVEDEYQRMGVATAMWQEFERQGIQPQHSDEKTQSGTAWANAVDGNPKDDMDNYTDWMGDVFGSVRTAEAYDADPLESQGKPAFDFENVFGENQPDDDGTRHFKYLWPDPNPGEKDGERHVWEVNGLDGYPWHNQVLTELYGRPNVSGYHKGMARLLANGVMDDYYGNRLPLAEEAHIREKFGIETNL